MDSVLQVPLVDLRAQYLSLRPEIDAAVRAVLEQGSFNGGPDKDRFEESFADYVGAEHGVGVSSGTDALSLALMALSVGPGDEVITVPYTFIATCEAISRTGADIVLVDIDPNTYTMDPAAFEAAITPRTKAVIPVHLYGQTADIERVLAIATRHGICVVEDAAQAHGARFRGRRAGSFGAAGCFSFYPSKNLGAFGDAGAVVTSDAELAKRVRLLANHGESSRYRHETVGGCSRLDNLQAAILNVKLPSLERWNRKRRKLAETYDSVLKDVAGVSTPHASEAAEHVFHLYVVRTRERDTVREEMMRRGIAVGVHYPVPVHLQPAYRELGFGPGDFPHAEAAAREVLSLPIYPELEESVAHEIATVLAEVVSR